MCSFCLKPLPFRGGVGVGGASTLRKTREPTPLRLSSKLASLTAPPLKGRGEYCQTKNWLIHSALSAGLSSPSISTENSSVCCHWPGRFLSSSSNLKWPRRSDERRVGKKGVGTGRSRWSPLNKKKKIKDTEKEN